MYRRSGGGGGAEGEGVGGGIVGRITLLVAFSAWLKGEAIVAAVVPSLGLQTTHCC